MLNLSSKDRSSGSGLSPKLSHDCIRINIQDDKVITPVDVTNELISFDELHLKYLIAITLRNQN